MTLPQFEHLTIIVAESIAHLQLTRPHKLNALSLSLLNEITDAAAWLKHKLEIRCVILSGAGNAFCAGADLDGFPQISDSNVREAADAGRKMADALDAIHAVTIAQIHGWCVGGGVVIASACDLRLAAESARFSIPEVDLGIPLAWGGIPRLVREIGPAMTKELVITCREFSSEEAKSIGFLNRVVPDFELADQAQSLALEIAAKPKMPVQSTKQHVQAVSEQMAQTTGAWADADGLLAGLLDPECQALRERAIQRKMG